MSSSVTTKRKFRFSVQERGAESAKQWRDRARALESMGYSTLYVPDHFGDQSGPIAALMAAADATTKLRIGSLVFDNDFRNPVVLAKEAATIDLLSDGRFDFGIGAGWLISDYEHAGVPYDSAAVRIERLAEAITIIKKLFLGEEVSFKGKHYSINGAKGTPTAMQKPHPPFVIGGGGRKMLELAAREADVVNVNFDLRTGRRGPTVAQTGRAEATEEKIRWIREAAGERFDEIELGVWILQANVTEERDTIASNAAQVMQMEPAEVLAVPHLLIGSLDQIREDIVTRRERYGISHVVLPGNAADQLAPMVERLSGE